MALAGNVRLRFGKDFFPLGSELFCDLVSMLDSCELTEADELELPMEVRQGWSRLEVSLID